MNGLNDLSDIERIKLLKAIRVGCKSNAEFESYLKEYSGTLGVDEVKRRLEGLFLEDEFALLCRIMGTCISMTGMDQRLIISNKLKTPDYLMVFEPGCSIAGINNIELKYSCFVEVKTTSNAETKRLSTNLLSGYSAFALQFGIPFLVASRLQINNKQAYWLIQTLEHFSANGRKSSVELLEDSVGDVLLDDCFITTTKEIILIKEFTLTPECTKAFDDNFGYLNKLTICTPSATYEIDDAIIPVNLFLDCFPQEIMESGSNNSIKYVKSKIVVMESQLLSDILLRANGCVLSSDGELQANASRRLCMLESGKSLLVSKELFYKTLSYINKIEFLFMILGIGSPESKARKIEKMRLSMCALP